MGVSVSYNGSGGRKSFNLDGVPTGDAAKTLGLPQKKHYVPDTLKKMLEMPAPKDPIEEAQKGKVKLDELDANPGTLADKMLLGGGVVVSQHGICLKGEEQSPLVTGVKLFGSVNGSKKYHSIDEIDPKGEPHHVGAKHGDASVDPNNEAAVEKQPQSYQVTSRIVVERDDIARLLKFYEFDKDVSNSPWGRTVGVTAERRRMICSIPIPRADDGEARPLPYEVRWDAELDDGEGGWKIYLPTPHLLSRNGEDIVTSGISGVTAINDGWYSLDDVTTSSTHVWLVLSVDDTDGSVEAELSPTQGQSVTGTTVHNICVAEISYTDPPGAGEPPTIVVKQSLVGALHLGYPTIPDDVSTELIPAPGEGEELDGDEGRLQIKGFKTGMPEDPNTIVDYLEGTVQLPRDGMWLIARGISTGGTPVLGYIPLAALSDPYGKDAGIYITQEPIAPSTDHPGGGVQITFQPLQDGQPHGQPTVVTLWNGSGGGGGGTDLSDTPALDVVPSTGQASAGVAVTASRQDHVHKMPATVVLTNVNQTINSVKTIGPPAGSAVARLDFQRAAGSERVRLRHSLYNGEEVFQMFLDGLGSNAGNFVTIQGTFLELGARGTGTGAIDDVRLGTGADAALANIEPSTSSRRVVDVKWVTNHFMLKVTPKTQKVLTDVEWDATNHRLVKHYKTLTVLDTANENDAYIETTAISSIIPQSS